MNLHLPFDYLLELQGSLIPSNAPNPNALPVNGRNRFSVQLDGDAPWACRAILHDDDQSPEASPLRWNIYRSNGRTLASTMLGDPPAATYGVTLNPEFLYKPNDVLQMDAGAGAASAGGFTFVFRGVKYFASAPETRPDAELMEFSYFDEFTMNNGGVGGLGLVTVRRSILLDPDADFVLQTLSYDVTGNYLQLRMKIWDSSYRALSNAHIPIQCMAGDWGGNASVPRTFAPDVLYPANGTITYEFTSWSPAEVNPTIDIRLGFSGVKRYRR